MSDWNTQSPKNLQSTGQSNSALESKETILKTISANQARTHFGDVIRQIVEDGDPIIVERAGEPQVAVISLTDLERLCGPLDEEPGSPRQTASDRTGQESSTSNSTGTDWWDEFERELCELPIE